MTRQAQRVWEYILLNRSTYSNSFSEPMGKIASALKMNKAHVRDALMELTHLGYLDRERRLGATYMFYVNKN
jgi:Mn-dependent DtxR family transcriptional regulator